jgi:predicted HicB family RNase H-like nuclease
MDVRARRLAVVKGPTKRDKRLIVRLPDAVLDRLRVVAQADGRSISDWALRALERELELAEAQLSRRPRGGRA